MLRDDLKLAIQIGDRRSIAAYKRVLLTRRLYLAGIDCVSQSVLAGLRGVVMDGHRGASLRRVRR
jgi:hypothetical protein